MGGRRSEQRYTQSSAFMNPVTSAHLEEVLTRKPHSVFLCLPLAHARQIIRVKEDELLNLYPPLFAETFRSYLFLTLKSFGLWLLLLLPYRDRFVQRRVKATKKKFFFATFVARILIQKSFARVWFCCIFIILVVFMSNRKDDRVWRVFLLIFSSWLLSGKMLLQLVVLACGLCIFDISSVTADVLRTEVRTKATQHTLTIRTFLSNYLNALLYQIFSRGCRWGLFCNGSSSYIWCTVIAMLFSSFLFHSSAFLALTGDNWAKEVLEDLLDPAYASMSSTEEYVETLHLSLFFENKQN